MHDDAERALVGSTIKRMDVRHLNHGQQREQGQTQHRRKPES